ncbi:hypothetical protein ACKYVA_22050, partial [Paenibacillus larvae]|uniref:hypothetical protein n=1 Tax=Paenibacillus larvae TaxID=1464 RepID=UPI003907F892
VPGTCHFLDELRRGLFGDAHPDHGAETAPRAGAQLQMIKGEVLKARGKSGQSQECPRGAIPHQ